VRFLERIMSGAMAAGSLVERAERSPCGPAKHHPGAGFPALPSRLMWCCTVLVVLATGASAQDNLDQRREQIEALSPSAKRELMAKKDRFDRLPEAEKERLRKLDEQIRRHPRSAELQQVLQHYGQWLATLSSKDQAELQELSPAERLARIQQLRQHEQDRQLSQCGLNARDANTVYQWWDILAEQNSALLASTLNDNERQVYERLNEQDPRRTFMLRAAVWRSLDEVLNQLPRDDINRLIDQLSEAAGERFLKLETPEQQNELLEKWVRESIRYRIRPPVVTDDELLGMIERLPKEEKDRLEKLPRDEMLRALKERWEGQQMQRRMRSPRGFRRGGFEERRDGDERFRGERPPGFPGPPPDRREDGGPRGRRPEGPPRFDEGRFRSPPPAPDRAPPPAAPLEAAPAEATPET
jgi:hypothetical protein